VKLEDAEVVVSGGRGIGSAKNGRWSESSLAFWVPLLVLRDLLVTRVGRLDAPGGPRVERWSS